MIEHGPDGRALDETRRPRSTDVSSTSDQSLTRTWVCLKRRALVSADDDRAQPIHHHRSPSIVVPPCSVCGSDLLTVRRPLVIVPSTWAMLNSSPSTRGHQAAMGLTNLSRGWWGMEGGDRRGETHGFELDGPKGRRRRRRYPFAECAGGPGPAAVCVLQEKQRFSPSADGARRLDPDVQACPGHLRSLGYSNEGRRSDRARRFAGGVAPKNTPVTAANTNATATDSAETLVGHVIQR